MKKSIVTKWTAAGLTLFAAQLAHGGCNNYEAKPRYWTALHKIAQMRGENLQQLCRHEGLLDVYATASQIITIKGDVIPHTRVEFVYNQHVCQYLISDIDQSVAHHYCYSAF